jgi:hypothetical protein
LVVRRCEYEPYGLVVQNVFEKEDLWDLLEPEDDGSGDEEPNVDNALLGGSHTVMTPAERALLRRRKLRAISMLKLIVSPKVLPFIRDIREPAAIWRFSMSSIILTR